ncbi:MULTISPECIES: hypothetical protein [Vibrio]|uniref:Uncharacterized protein n=1 Tax=Vibrio ostreae TaxID=2841925 RepID=A0A975U723_9VIBR|nr:MULTISPECIES: hypothetical protein [Vibrio]QXO16145.1 hypothetical protein KNV97_01065 [Vibrio ostreae]
MADIMMVTANFVLRVKPKKVTVNPDCRNDTPDASHFLASESSLLKQIPVTHCHHGGAFYYLSFGIVSMWNNISEAIR